MEEGQGGSSAGSAPTSDVGPVRPGETCWLLGNGKLLQGRHLSTPNPGFAVSGGGGDCWSLTW